MEQRILDVLRTSQGNILDDEKAIDALAQSQRLAQEIQHKQEVATATQAKLDQARKGYSPVAHHCSLLFFLVSKLVRADVMYQYSLTWFLQLFHHALENFRGPAPEEDAGSEVPLVVGIEELTDYFTYALYSNVCRSLFEKDKLLFSFMLAAKLAQARGGLSPNEYELLVQTQDGLEEAPSGVRNEWPSWLPNARWLVLCQMASQSPAIDAVVHDFGRRAEQWRVITESESPLGEEFPSVLAGEEPVVLGSFTKLCLVKALAPGKFIPAVREYVLRESGARYLSPPLFDIERSYDDSSCMAPLIFVLPGSDPLQALTAFARRKKKIEGLRTISLGQGQGARAETAIAEARKHGGWVLLQNCHLHPSWMPRLEQICDQLASRDPPGASPAGGDSTHPAFRLWLSSYRSDAFPALVLRNGVKMTNEPPSGLAANMSRSCISTRAQLEQLTEQAAEPEAAQRLYFGLCMFHAVVEGRRNYGALGWNVRYDFSISDLQITTRQLCFYASSSQTFAGAVSAVARLAGDCNYGGRLADERDRRVLLALLEEFCTPGILSPGYKAHGLEGYPPPTGARDLNDHLAHIQALPQGEPPELFGLHANASISKNLRDMNELCGQLLRMGEVEGLQVAHEAGGGDGEAAGGYGSVGTRGPEGDEARVAALCRELLARLPSSDFELASVRQKYPMSRERSMNSVLVQELQRFNTLAGLITASLTNLLQTLSGGRLASEATEQLHASVLHGEVPARWLKASYPTQLTLASYVADLRRRLTTFERWIAEGPPPVFWLPGFFSPQSFLTAVLQDHARRHRAEIDRLTFAFEFQERSAVDREDPCSDAWRQLYSAPSEGAYICGLYLEGAAWSSASPGLRESSRGELHSRMPVILLKPIR